MLQVLDALAELQQHQKEISRAPHIRLTISLTSSCASKAEGEQAEPLELFKNTWGSERAEEDVA